MSRWSHLLEGLGPARGARRYATNTAWLFADRGLQMALGIVIGAILARYLGPERYGIYAYALSYSLIFSTVANLGLGPVLVKELVEGRGQSGARASREGLVLGTSTGLRLGGALVGFLVVVVLTAFTDTDALTRLAVVIAATAYLPRSVQTLIFWFQAEVQGKAQVVAHLASLLVSSALKILFVVQERPLIWFLVLLSVDALLYGLGLLVAYRRRGGRFASWRFERPYAAKLLKQSWPLFFSLIITTFYMQIDQLMIKHLLGSAETGLYAAAVRLSSAWYAFPWILTGSIFPALLRAQKDDPPLFRRRIRGIYLLLIGMALALVLPVMFLAGPIVQVIFGQAYAASAGVLVVHIGASLFVFMGFAGDKWLLGAGLQRYTAINTFGGALVNVAINLVVIPRYGILGAAWATLIAQAFSYHFALLLWPQTRPIFIEQSRALFDLLSLGPLRRRG